MKRCLLLFLFSAILTVSAAAEVQYTGDIDEEEVRMNTTLELECSNPCPVSRWSLTWTVPENAEIMSIKDSYGEIDDWERNGRSLSITTNSGDPRRTETLKIQLVIDESAETMYRDLRYRKISLPAFSEEDTTGRFEIEDMVSGWIGYGFQSSFSGDTFTFRGEGPTNIRVNFGEGVEREHYEFFGEERENSSEAYRIALGTTGVMQHYPLIPVAIMDSGSYNQSVNRWSSGEYVAGTITVRERLEEDYLPVLAHETIHALNDEFLRWDQTRSAYLDEGVSEHAEYLMKKKLYREGRIETGTREVFGDEKEYEVRMNGKKYIYTLPSQGERDVLWNYYQEDADFMKSWNAESSSEYRQFGYAYSELIIKNHIVNQDSIRSLYSELGPGRKMESADEKWSYLAQYMDMTPCKYDSRERFNQCLDRINDYDYPIYTATPSATSDSELRFDEIDVPNRTAFERKNSGLQGETQVDFQDFLKGFIDYILSLLE